MIKSVNSITEALTSLGRSPAFYLIYLLFYFIPWMSVRPSLRDVTVTVIAMGIFLPVHFLSFKMGGNMRKQGLWPVIITESLAVMTAPINGMNGVFHIYAGAQAAYFKSPVFSAFIFLCSSVIYAVSAYYFNRHAFEIIFTICMAAIVWIGCLQDARQQEDREAKDRRQELEKQQASLIERERIARDLHDFLGHTLTMVSLKSDLAFKLLDKEDITAARQEIDDIRRSSRQALSDIRQVLSGVKRTSLTYEINNAHRALTTANITFKMTGEIPLLEQQQDYVAALALREAVTNTIRHSNASQFGLSFSKDAQNNIIKIEDNGSGSHAEIGQGLMGVKERIIGIGGDVDINLRHKADIFFSFPINI